jgi:hypothetical protein
MKKSLISDITVVTQQGVGVTSVGGIVNGRVITEIEEFYQDEGVFSEYFAKDKEGNILKRIINCPVDISYNIID